MSQPPLLPPVLRRSSSGPPAPSRVGYASWQALRCRLSAAVDRIGVLDPADFTGDEFEYLEDCVADLCSLADCVMAGVRALDSSGSGSDSDIPEEEVFPGPSATK